MSTVSNFVYAVSLQSPSVHATRRSSAVRIAVGKSCRIEREQTFSTAFLLRFNSRSFAMAWGAGRQLDYRSAVSCRSCSSVVSDKQITFDSDSSFDRLLKWQLNSTNIRVPHCLDPNRSV